jgi:hypothetical protein
MSQADIVFRRPHAFFSKAGPARYLSGFGYDGKYIGWYSSVHSHYHLEVKSLRGVHWARDSSGAIPALKIKDGQEWKRWYGMPALGIDDCEIAWAQGCRDPTG